MQKEQQSTMTNVSHLYQDTKQEVVMVRPHRQHQFHCDEIQQIMDVNTRQNTISLHVPPYFQDMQKNC